MNTATTTDDPGPLIDQPAGPPPGLHPSLKPFIDSITRPGTGTRPTEPGQPIKDAPDAFGVFTEPDDASGAASEVAAAAAELRADDHAAESGAVPTFADESHDPLETEYTWENYFPRGPAGVIVVAAERESGKGLVGCKIIGDLTTGRLLPGETGERTRIIAGLSPKAPVDVVGVWDEDDANEDNAWRLRAAGADLSRVFDFTELPGGGEFELGTSLTDPGNIPDLLAFLRELRRTCLAGHVGLTGTSACTECGGPMRNPQFVIMDPLDNLVKGTIQSKQGAGRLLRRLRFVARKTGTTIVLVHHTVESGKVGGSSKVVDIPRRVFRIERDDAIPEYRVFRLAKSNGRRAPALRYRIIGDGHASRIEWADAAQVRREEDAWRKQPAAPPHAPTALPAAPAPPAQPPATPVPPRAAQAGQYAAAWSIKPPGQAAQVHPIQGAWRTLQAAQGICQASATHPLTWQPGSRPGAWVAITYPQGADGPEVSYAVSAAPGKQAS